MQPEQIETLSFRIIDQEAGPHDFTPEQWQVVRRMIHTSADFELMKTVRFHPAAIEAGMAAIRNGCTIFTDTNMARVGIRKGECRRFGIATTCLIADPDISARATAEGITRAKAAMDALADRMGGQICVIGNAPTALLQLVEMLGNGVTPPALIVGLPVGFVNAAESKEALMALDVPYIANTGRKGGSNLAAAAINALLKMADHKSS